MKILIDIAEERYAMIKSDLYNTLPAEMKEWGLEAIRNGTPIMEECQTESLISQYQRLMNATIQQGVTDINWLFPESITQTKKLDL